MAQTFTLPLFPLGLVLYPGGRMPVHIYEARYKEMVQYCLANEQAFGVVLLDEGEMAEVGCTARIDQIVKRYEDGRVDIMVTGEQRFRILRTREERAFLMADVEEVPEPREPVKRNMKERAITQHMKLLELAGRTLRPTLYQGTREVSFILAHNAGLTPRQQQQVLELPGENERIAYLVDHFESLIPRLEQREDFRRKVQSNGHFKDFPPEKS